MSTISSKEEGLVDDWNSRERLYLASCVLSHGDDNWSTVSDVMKSFVNTKLRSLEFYSPEKCASQYSWMIKDLEKMKTIADNESRLELLEKHWREKRYKELKEDTEQAQTLITQLSSDLEILKSGVLDDYLWILIEEFKKHNVPFWQRHGKRIMQAMATVRSEESTSKGKAPAAKTTEFPSHIPQNIDVSSLTKEVSKDAVHVGTHSTLLSSKTLSGDGGGGIVVFSTKDGLPSPKISPTVEQPLTTTDSLSPQSPRKVEITPKAFFNPSNLLTSSAAGFFALSPAASSHGAAAQTTTTVSSVTLSAPTLSKLLEMPPSFAGKLPPLPVSPRTKGVTPVLYEKSPQKVSFKPIGIPTTLEHSDSNLGKFVSINVGDNIKVEGKHILIKPSDVNSLLSKTNEHAQLILQQAASVDRSNDTVFASFLQSEANRKVQADNKTQGKNMPVLASPVKQEGIVSFFKPKETVKKIQDNSPMKNILNIKTDTCVDKSKDNISSPTFQKLTPTKITVVESTDTVQTEKHLTITSCQSPSKTTTTSPKTISKPLVLPVSGNTVQTKETSALGSDPFTFDETSDKFSDKTKTFSRGIKRKRDSVTDGNAAQTSASASNELTPEKSKTQTDSISLKSPLKTEDNIKTSNETSKPNVSEKLNKDIVSHELPHMEISTNISPLKTEVTCSSKMAKKQQAQEISNSTEPKITTPIVRIKMELDSETLPTTSSYSTKKLDSDFDQLLQSCVKSESEIKKEPIESPNDPDVGSFSELLPLDSKQSKDGDSIEKDGVYDFPSEEKSPDVKLRPRYSSTTKGRRGGRTKAADKNNKIQESPDASDEGSAKEKTPIIVKTENKTTRKSTASLSSMEMAEDESTTSSQDSEKEFQSQNTASKGVEDQYKSDADDVFEKKISELSDGDNSSSKSALTFTKDGDTNDTSASSKHSSVSISSVVRGKESKSRWSPASIDRTSQSMVTPTTSDSDDSDNFEMSDDSTNPDAKQSKLKWADRESENKYKAWKKSICIVWREAANHRYANVFAQKVTDDVAPGYHNIVSRPMDLATIKRNIDNGTIKTTEEFQRDVMLMFQNAIMYNSSDHDVYNMAIEMQRDVFMQIQDLANQLTMQDENKESLVSTLRNVRQTKGLHKLSQKSISKDS